MMREHRIPKARVFLYLISFLLTAIFINTPFVEANPSGTKPNLIPYAPSGWDHPVVPSMQLGTNTVGSLTICQYTYIDYAYRNTGNADIPEATRFYTRLSIDDNVIRLAGKNGLLIGHYGYKADVAYTEITPGWHTLKLEVDYYDDVDEEEETDNVFLKEFFWNSNEVSGYLTDAGEIDEYSFSISSESEMFINLLPPDGVNYDVVLYSANDLSTPLAWPQLGADQREDVVIHLSAGEYLIRVYGVSGVFDATQPYRLAFGEVGECLGSGNYTAGEAAAIQLPYSQKYYAVDFREDDEWFQFTLTEPQTVYFTLDPPVNRNYRLQLFSSDDVDFNGPLAETVSGQGLVDNLEVNLESGMFYFKVEGVDGAFGADEDFWLYIRSSSNLADFNFSRGDPYDNFTGATGKRWPEEAIPLKYFIDETGAPPGFSTAVREAFNTWSQAGRISFTQGTSEDWVVMILWSEDGTLPSPPFEAGEVFSSFSRAKTRHGSLPVVSSEKNRKIYWSYIVFNGNDFQWSTTGETRKLDIQDVATHEIGHLLRLDHTEDPAQTMAPASVIGSTFRRTLHFADIAGCQYLYNGKLMPALVDPPQSVRSGEAFSLSFTLTNQGLNLNEGDIARLYVSFSKDVTIETDSASQGWDRPTPTVFVIDQSEGHGDIPANDQVHAVKAGRNAFPGNGHSENITLTVTAPGSGILDVYWRAAVEQSTGRERPGILQPFGSATKDAAGWPAHRTAILVDPSGPNITGLSNDSIPTRSKNWNWGADEPASFRYAVDMNPSWIPSGNYGAVTTATQTPGDGVYYLHVQAMDLDGNESAVVTVSAILDNTQPTVTISRQPDQSLYNGDYRITVSAGEGVMEYKLDSDPWISYSAPVLVDDEGFHTFDARSTDAAGNVGTAASISFQIDKSPPLAPTLNTVITPTRAPLQIISGNKEANSSVLINGVEIVALSALTAWSYDISLMEGDNAIRLTSIDAAGNESSQSTATITLDTMAPTAALSGYPVGKVNISEVDISVGGEGVTHYKYKLDNGPFSGEIAVSNKIMLSNLAEGSHRLYVIGRDRVGNWQPEQQATIASWDVDIVLSGDVNDDRVVDLKDAIICARIICGIHPEDSINKAADVNEDGKIGIHEAIYVLQRLAETKENATIEDLTYSEFMTQLKQSVAGKESDAFVRLVDSTVKARFEDLLEALLGSNLTSAQSQIEAINALDVRYKLIRITDAVVGGPVFGFMERVNPGDFDYRGWGAVLVRPNAPGYTIFQAPHIIADQYTEDIALKAFMDYPNALIAMFAGAHRHAGADTDADGWKDSDVAHDTENLFHGLTVYIANRGQAGSTRYWFAQIHGASDRASEPTIVGSNGADAPVLTSDSPLVQIDGAVDAAEYMTMGVCGWDEGAGDEEDGNYLLCATTNIQGDFLESLGLRQTFKHFEIERHARDDYHSGSGPGYDGILNLLQAITNVLNSQ